MAVLSVVVPVVLGTAPKAHAATAQNSKPFTLDVVSARTVGGASTITKGDPVLGSTTLTAPDPTSPTTTTTSYKWLITADDNGNPADSNANCLPVAIDPTSGAPQFNPDGSPVTNSAYSPGKGSYGTWNATTQRYEDANGNPFDASTTCQWPSTRYTPGAVAILGEGEVHQPRQSTDSDPGSLPPGKYLVSVIANGYKIDGAHFTVAQDGSIHDLNGAAVTTVTVGMQPYPLPLGTLRLQVFKDIAPVDATYEAGTEPGLAGFTAHLNDVLAEVTTDFYGNRLCTNYVHQKLLASSDPNFTPAGGTPHAGYSRSNYDISSPVVFSGGLPVIDGNDPGGKCLSDVDGLVVIPNLGPDRYTATVIPPSGQNWYQTTTLEGNHDWDMWIHEGDTGYDHELTVGGEPIPPVDMGYVPFATNSDGVTPRAATVTAGSGVPGYVTLTFGATDGPSVVPPAGQIVTLQRPVTIRYRAGRFNQTTFLAAGDATVFSSTGSTITLPAAIPAGATNITVTIATGTLVTLPDAAPRQAASTVTGGVTGKVVELNAYVGGKGGVSVPTADQLAGTNVRGPVPNPIVALSDLNNNDQMVWVGRGNTDGTFTAPHIPNGSYQITFWDYNQDLIINSVNVDVKDGKVTDMGQQALVDWYTDIKGKIFIDANGNGKFDCTVPGSKDPSLCEQGVPKFAVTFKQRDNSLFDAGQNLTTTDDSGNYEIREGYPITRWGILEAFNTRYKTTGITVKADNEPQSTTYMGAAVDVNILPIIGLSGQVDWGVQPYSGAQNGGIAGTVTYDTTRNELDPKYAFTEDYQPGIPNIPMHLYYPVRDANGDVEHNADGSVKVVMDPADPTKPLDISDTYTSETWEQPTGCTARMQDGSPLNDQLALPPFNNDAYQCVEAPMAGWQGVPSTKSGDGGFSQTVNGNYAFSQMNYTPEALACAAALQGGDTSQAGCDTANPLTPTSSPVDMPADDYVVQADIPKLPDGTPIYKVTKEEDVNIFDGDIRMPQENYPLSAGDLQAAGAAGSAPGDGGPVSQQPGIWFDCAGANHTVHVTDQPYLNGGGSPFEGQARPLCDAKLVSTRGNQTVAPNFNLFTDVPLPTHFWGLTINDLGISHDKTQVGYGEAEPLPNVPMGIYDWSGRLVDSVMTDHNGMYESTEPSTSSYNCPLPAGPCPGMYYFKGNDPGQPGRPNKAYNPRFRTIGTDFQAWPGLFTPTDTAPTQTSAIAITPDGAIAQPVICDVNAGVTDAAKTTPDIYAIDQPYVKNGSTSPQPKNVPAQTLAVSSITTTTGFPNRTARLTVTGLDTTALPPTITVNLTATNAPTMNAALRTALSGTHTVTDITKIGSATTIAYSFTASGTTPNVTNYVPTGLSATTPAFSTTSIYHPAQQVTATTVTTTGTTNAKTVTLTVPTDTVDTSVQWPSVSLPLTGLPNVGLWAFLLAGSHANPTVTAHTIAFPVTTGLANVSASNAGFTVTLPTFTTQITGAAVPRTVTITGSGFGSAAGSVALKPATGTSNAVANVTSWSDTKIVVSVTSSDGNAQQAGVYQLTVTGSNGRQSVNGLSLHILGTGYNPTLIQVNPDAAHGADSAGRNFGYVNGGAGTWENTSVVDDRYDAAGNYVAAENVIQRALDAARAFAPGQRGIASTAPAPLVVVWPKDPSRTPATNATGDYFENLVIGAAVKLQGVGAGGFQGSGTTATYVAGTRLNGLGFNADNLNGTQWINTVTSYGPDPATVPDGAAITVLGNGNSTTGGSFDTAGSTANRRPSIDGLTITGGDEGGAGLANQNTINGANTTPVGGTGALSSQGGGVYLFGGADNVQISNNHIDGNSGAYGGGVRVGTAYTANTAGTTPSNWANTNVAITNNRITDNGGTNLAGGIGLFDGSSGYVIDHNDVCGNFSSEYGGGISHYGRSDTGKITANRIYLNQSYDEGGGVMIAGELNANLTQPSLGAASTNSSLTIDGNLVQDNLANDDGGGIRFLSAGRVRIDVTNNSVVDNISTHEGGGFALDDSTNVRIIGNTVMKNLTTASAITSNGQPAAAGLSTANNSTQLQATLPAGSPAYSQPTLIDDIFADNRAGSFDLVTGQVHGIGMAGDNVAPNVWDIGSLDTLTPKLPVTSSVLTSLGTTGNNNNITFVGTGNKQAPATLTALVVNPFDVAVSVENSRTNPAFRQSIIISKLAAPQLLGDYHLAQGSVAVDGGTDQSPTYPAYKHDIDNQDRPRGTGYDIGSDEY